MSVPFVCRVFIPILGLSMAAAAVPAQVPAAGPAIAPTPITYNRLAGTVGEAVEAIQKSSGIPIAVPGGEAKTKISASYDRTPLWQALDGVAKSAGLKVVLHDKGTRVALEPRGKSREVVAASGAFRVAAKQVIGRELLDLGSTVYEVGLEVNWEPRVRVFRIDAQPRITRAVDDRGVALTSPAASAGTYPADAVTEMQVRLGGLTRESKRIAVLAGEFKAVAAEKLLAVRFADLTAKLPQTRTQDGVSVTLKGPAKVETAWEAEVQLVYPEGHPVFESFEEQKWLRDNRLRLVPPGGKAIDPESDDVAAHGRRVTATYRFPGTINPLAKGWTADYETPSPLVEVTVPFELKDLPLP
jgi:hypothetical protein